MQTRPLLWIFLLWVVSAKLYFRFENPNQGSIIPYPKDKNVDLKVFEDWFITTPAVITVADGIGGVRFPTSHFAQAITTRATQFLLSNREAAYPTNKDFETAVSEQVLSEVNNYNANIRLAVESTAIELTQKLERPVTINENHFMASATFITAAIENTSDESSTLNVFQKGDSGMIVFTLKKHSEEINAFHYDPT